MHSAWAWASAARPLIATVLGALAPAAAAAVPIAESFLEAQQLGRRDETDPATVDYHRTVLLPQFSSRYRALLRECQGTLPQPDQTPFSFVVVLGPDGGVLRLLSDSSPPVYSCVRGRLAFERFSAPPRAPFYLYMHMRFVQ